MRASPLNYLLTVALGGLVFFVASVLIGNYLGNTVSLLGFTIPGFLQLYRIVVAVAVALGVALTFVWLSYGSRPATAGKLPQAKQLWLLLFSVGLAEAGSLLGALMFFLRAEAFTGVQYVILFVVVSLATYLLFWFCTLLMSPPPVKRIPWGMGL
jgi:hypothetical protein